jgi:hypothetical protein
MSAIKFICPGCAQHIECGPEYAGVTVNCPTCQVAMMVPGAPATAVAVACPSCGAALQSDAVLCTSCGFNLRTGKRVQPQVTSAPSRRMPVPESSGIGSGNMIAIGLLIIFGALFGLGFTNQSIAAAFHVAQAIFWLVVTIMVIVAAFRESTGTGFLTMCVPCYVLYFVYSVNDNPTLKMLYSIAILTRLAGFALPFEGFGK